MRVLLEELAFWFPPIEKVPIELITEALTALGLEVKDVGKWAIRPPAEDWLVGVVREVTPHQDRYCIVRIDVGSGTFLTALSGDRALRPGEALLVAPPGSFYYDVRGARQPVEQREIAGVVSECLLLSEREAGVSTRHEGVWRLSPVEAVPGMRALRLLQPASYTYIDLDLTPNRADALSHLGVARELRAWLVFHGHVPADESLQQLPSMEDWEPTPTPWTIRIKDGAWHYAGMEITDLVVRPSLWKVQAFLRALNQTPVNNIVDITNCLLFQVGQPLHAFDRDRLVQPIIEVRSLERSQSFQALDGKTYTLQEGDIVIAQGDRILALAGIIGGADSAVHAGTRAIFLESATFFDRAIRRTVRRLRLNTEAGIRFSRGVDPTLARDVLPAAAYLFTREGGKCYAPAYAVHRRVEPRIIAFPVELAERLTGQPWAISTIRKAFQLLDIRVVREEGETLTVDVPYYRVDVVRPVDLVEELLRLTGTDAIPEVATATIPMQVPKFLQSSHEFFLFLQEVERYWRNCGFQPHVGLSFVSEEGLRRFGWQPEQCVRVLESVWENRNYLRPHLLPSMIEGVRHQRVQGTGRVVLMEIGKVFSQGAGNNRDGVPEEAWALGMIFWQALRVRSVLPETDPRSQPRVFPFFWLKGEVEMWLSEALGLSQASLYTKEIALPWTYRAIQFFVEGNEEPLGELGWVNAQVVRAEGIKEPVYYGFFLLEPLFRIYSRMKRVPLLDLPGTLAYRDVSFLAPVDLRWATIHASIRAHLYPRGHFLSYQVIDVYEAPRAEARDSRSMRRSYTIRLWASPPDEVTLDKWYAAFVRHLQETLPIQIRA